MNVKNTVGLLGLLVLTVSLSGCFGHKNPLKTSRPEDSARFLVHASQYAEKQLHVFQDPGSYYYGLCMKGKKKAEFCQKLYASMVQFAKKSTHFKSLTVDDLMSKSMWNLVYEDYERESFEAI
jgi:hypothetical protein